MSPEKFRLYWFIMNLYTRTRYLLRGDSVPTPVTTSYLALVRIISPEKRCTGCLQKVGLFEVLRDSDNLATERQFAYNGEQLYRSVIHIDCP